MDYAYSKVDSIVEMVRERAKSPVHNAFASHLDMVSKALRALEWVWSCDCSDGDVGAIMAVITPNDVLVVAIEQARKAKCELEKAIALATEDKKS